MLRVRLHRTEPGAEEAAAAQDFKVKTSTAFGQVIDAFCGACGVLEADLDFFFRDRQISRSSTPAALRMEAGSIRHDIHARPAAIDLTSNH